jgi:L-alanine-DL-glutamate epimerase-like enolase superfamily enzyme
MKIISVEVMALKAVESAATRPIVCKINTDEGIYGYGEAGVAIVTGAGSLQNDSGHEPPGPRSDLGETI